MRASGSQVQNEIYITGQAPWPIAPEDWEAKARAALADGRSTREFDSSFLA